VAAAPTAICAMGKRSGSDWRREFSASLKAQVSNELGDVLASFGYPDLE
jgi:hypothetical protein